MPDEDNNSHLQMLLLYNIGISVYYYACVYSYHFIKIKPNCG
jgi:hypothetical protein